VFFLLEQENKFVRFHAIQSILVFGVITVAGIVLGWIPFIGGVFAGLIGVLGFALWIILMIRAYQGAKFKLPWSGNLAEKWVSSQDK